MALASMAALISTFGCTPSGNGDGGGAGGMGGGVDGGAPPAAGGDYVADLTGYLCDLVEQCQIQNDTLLMLDEMFDSAGVDCHDHYEGLLRGQIGDRFQDLEYDVEAFARCRAASVEACMPMDLLPGCQEIVIGRRGPGEACATSDQCMSGLFCDFAPDAEGDCDQACQPRRAAGEVCFRDDECADGADAVGFCHRGDDGAGTCQTLRPQSGKAPDEACGRIETDDGWVFATCRTGAHCSEAGVCRLNPGLGEGCDDDSTPCAEGFCIDSVCQAIDFGTAPGDGCDTRELQLCNPMSGLACVDEVCRATSGQAGEPCDDGDFQIGCAEGLYCDGEACRAQLADGSACDPTIGLRVCASAHCEWSGDDPYDGTCAPALDAPACQ